MTQQGMVDVDSELQIFEVIQRIQKLNKQQQKQKDDIIDVKNEIQGKREQLIRINENVITLKKTTRAQKEKLTKLQKKYNLDKNNKLIINKEYLMQKQKEKMQKEKDVKLQKKTNFFRFFEDKEVDEDEEVKNADLLELQKDELIQDSEEDERIKEKETENEFRIIRTLNNIIDGKSNNVKAIENDKYQQTVLVSHHKLDDILTTIKAYNSISVRFTGSAKSTNINLIYDNKAQFQDVLKLSYEFWSLPGKITDYNVIDEYYCEIVLETLVSDFIWTRSAMEFSQNYVQIDMRNIKQLEPHPMQLEASKQADDDKKEDSRKANLPIIEKSIIHVYRNKLLQGYEFITYFFEEFKGLKKYISKSSLENIDVLKLKGTIGFELDDYSFLSLFLVICIFSFMLASSLYQNDYQLIQTFNNNYQRNMNAFTYKNQLTSETDFMNVKDITNKQQVYQYLSQAIGPLIFKSVDDKLTTQVAKLNILQGKLILRQIIQKDQDCQDYEDTNQSKGKGSRAFKGQQPEDYNPKKFKCRLPEFNAEQTYKEILADGSQDWMKYKTAEQTGISQVIIDEQGQMIAGDGYVMEFDSNDSLEYFQAVLRAMETGEEQTYKNFDQSEGKIEKDMATYFKNNYMQYKSYRTILQFNIFNPQHNQFINGIIIVQISPLQRITINTPMLQNFKTTIYSIDNSGWASSSDPLTSGGTLNEIYSHLRKMDMASVVFCMFLLIHSLIQILYKNSTINIEYATSPEMVLNLLIIYSNLYSYYNSRSISDTDTTIQMVLKDDNYNSKYFDFSEKIHQYKMYKTYQNITILLLIQKMAGFLKLDRRLNVVIYIINLCGGNMMLYYVVVMPVYWGISQAISQIQGSTNQVYSSDASSFINTLFITLSETQPHEFIMYQPWANCILMYLIFIINSVLFKGVILGTQMETYRQQIRKLGYDFKNKDTWKLKETIYYLFAWLPRFALNKIIKCPYDVVEAQKYLSKEKYRKIEALENKKLKAI